MNSILKSIGRIFTEKKLDLVKKNKGGIHTHEQIEKVLNGEIINPLISNNKTLQNTGFNISNETLLELINLKKEDLYGKKILDIGGGFSDLPFLLDGSSTEINIVDPVFHYNIQEEINRNKSEIDKLLMIYNSQFNSNAEFVYDISIQLNTIKDTLKKWEMIDPHTHIKNKSNIGKNVVNIYPTTGENIEGIENNSMDIIFLNHVITKNPVNPPFLLEKAFKLLKAGGKIYITENGTCEKEHIGGNYGDFTLKLKNIDYIGNYKKYLLIIEKNK